MPGVDGTFYRIQANLSHDVDGSTNLHTHGLEVSPQPCHDEVIRSKVYAANFGGHIGPLLPCQSAPNELTYTYNIPADHPEGLYFYHTHRHGNALNQSMMGAAGAIVIKGSQDERWAARGVADDVMVIHDFPAVFVTPKTSPALPYVDVLSGQYTHERTYTVPDSPLVDPRIDRDNEVSCKRKDHDTGGQEFARLTLNGALVQETAAFPPPDDQVLVKTMKVGERQIWRILNAAGATYISPQLVLSQNGMTRVLPLKVIARDGVPVHDDNGNHHFEIIDTTEHPLLMATANRVEIVVHAPPPGATLYLDSQEVVPGCTSGAMPARRLLRVVSTGATDGVPAWGDTPSENDDDLLSPCRRRSSRIYSTRLQACVACSLSRSIRTRSRCPNSVDHWGPTQSQRGPHRLLFDDDQLIGWPGRLPSSPLILTSRRLTW